MLLGHRKPIAISAIVITVLLALPAAALAHNKVVVIPMAGDDIEVLPEPTSPLAKESPPNTDYTVNGLSTVVDKITGLEWQRLDDNTPRTFHDAFEYCVNLSLDSKTGWRLPLVTELVSLVDYDSDNPSINATVFPTTNSQAHWAAPNFANDASYAWTVDFADGAVRGGSKPSPFYVRCVR